MKFSFSLGALIVATLLFTGCGTTVAPTPLQGNTNATQETADQPGTPAQTEQTEQATGDGDAAEIGISEGDLQQLKADIERMEFEDISTISQ